MAALLDLSNLSVVLPRKKENQNVIDAQEINTRVLVVVKHFIDVTCPVWLQFGRDFRVSFYSALFNTFNMHETKFSGFTVVVRSLSLL